MATIPQTPSYEPPIDLAFKKRIAERFGWDITDRLVNYVINTIPNDTLNIGEQRVVLPDNVITALDVNIELNTVVSVLFRGETVNKTSIDRYINLGTYKNKTIYGLKLNMANFGYDPNKPQTLDAVYDAPVLEESRGIEEADPTIEEQTQEIPKKSKGKNK